MDSLTKEEKALEGQKDEMELRSIGDVTIKELKDVLMDLAIVMDYNF